MASRVRKFSCITYLNETQLKTVLLEHRLQIRNYAYILHDKDINGDGELKQPHFHIIIITYNTCTVSAVRRWFFGYVDKDRKDINTLGQVCNDIYSQYDYLTHKHNPEKYQYDSDNIVSLDNSYFLGGVSGDIDTTAQMLFDFVNGVSFRTMAKKYGKNFIYHYSSLRILACDMIREENCFGKECEFIPQQRDIKID